VNIEVRRNTDFSEKFITRYLADFEKRIYFVEERMFYENNDNQGPQNPPPPPVGGGGARIAIRPQDFNGSPDDDVTRYIEKFDRIAEANGWNEQDKLQVLPCYLGGAAADRYNLFDKTPPDGVSRWQHTTDKLKQAFKKPGEIDLFDVQLRNRLQGAGEPVQSYYFAVLNLCQKVNPQMTLREKVKHLLTGLKPDLVMRVGTMEAETPEKLMENFIILQELQAITGKHNQESASESNKMRGLQNSELRDSRPMNNSESRESENIRQPREYSNRCSQELQGRYTGSGSARSRQWQQANYSAARVQRNPRERERVITRD
jgi:hypothetical protein